MCDVIRRSRSHFTDMIFSAPLDVESRSNKMRLLGVLIAKHEVFPRKIEGGEFSIVDLSYDTVIQVFYCGVLVSRIEKKRPDLMAIHVGTEDLKDDMSEQSLVSSLQRCADVEPSHVEKSLAVVIEKVMYHTLQMIKESSSEMGAFDRKAELLARMIAGPKQHLFQMPLGTCAALAVESAAFFVLSEGCDEDTVIQKQRTAMLFWILTERLWKRVLTKEHHENALADFYVALVVVCHKLKIPLCLHKVFFAKFTKSGRSQIETKLLQNKTISDEATLLKAVTWNTNFVVGGGRNPWKEEGCIFGAHAVESIVLGLLEEVSAWLPAGESPFVYAARSLSCNPATTAFKLSIIHVNSADFLRTTSRVLEGFLDQITRDSSKGMVRVEDTLFSDVVTRRISGIEQVCMRDVSKHLSSQVKCIVEVLETFLQDLGTTNIPSLKWFPEHSEKTPFTRQRTVPTELTKRIMTADVSGGPCVEAEVNLEDEVNPSPSARSGGKSGSKDAAEDTEESDNGNEGHRVCLTVFRNLEAQNRARLEEERMRTRQENADNSHHCSSSSPESESDWSP